MSSLRIHTRVDLPWIYPRQLPDPITISRLYELTKPGFGDEPLAPDELGKWLAVLVLSLDPRGWPWDREIDEAERQFVPEPEQATTEPLESDPKRPHVSATFTTTGFADRNVSKVPSRTEAFRGAPGPSLDQKN
jgi:hypothetical protein